MEKIALVGCSAKKLGKNNPTQKYLAKDIYQGQNFKKSLEEGISKLSCSSDYYILSGKHGLLNPKDEIEYYDCYLGKCSVKYKKEWAENVLKELKRKFGNLNDYTFVFFCGQ